MRQDKNKQFKIGTLLLFIMLIIICGDATYKYLLGEKNTNGNNHVYLAINENVKFEKYSCDRALPFEVKDKSKLNLTISAGLGSGKISFYIISPDEKCIYEKSGTSINEQIVLDVYDGSWFCRVVCENGERGSYSISGTLE